MKTIVIQASARSNGNTNAVISHFRKLFKCDFIDLKIKNIEPYNYEHNYPDDDFISIMKSLINYDIIIFASPVYWYTMSGQLKIFLDRITDCLKIEKEIGRKLKGKQMAVIACGSKPQKISSFFSPFISISNYLGMKYIGHIHTWANSESLDKEVKVELQSFSNKLKGHYKPSTILN